MDLIGLILSFSAHRNRNGYDISSQLYFNCLKSLKNSLPQAPKRSSITEARAKLRFEAFEFLLDKLNNTAQAPKWKTHRVFAVDGSHITLPHSKEILSHFPLHCEAHYPKGLLVVATNVMSGVVKKATLTSVYGSERDELLKMKHAFKANDLLLLDRGYEGFSLWSSLEESSLKFICRMRAIGSVPREVKAFVESGARDRIVTLTQGKKSLTIRLLCMGRDYRGVPILLATNLLDKKSYQTSELKGIYRHRWKIETSYYRVKELMQLEKFHARTLNGSLQEIWANLFILSMTSLLAERASLRLKACANMIVSFKNALEVLASNLRYFVKANRRGRKQWIEHILARIRAITFTHQRGRKNPRVSKQSGTSWIRSRKNRLHENYKRRNGLR